MSVEIVSWRVTAVGPAADRQSGVDMAATQGAPKATRRAVFADGPVEVPVFDRDALSLDQRIEGAAIIEERETTIVILPGWTAGVDALGAIVAKRNG